MKIHFYKHNVSPEDINNVIQVLNSLFLTTGDVVNEFETRFSDYLNCSHTVGVTSCTAALHLSLLALGMGKGDEVITTPMTFIATANSILYTGATPIFIDVEPATGNLNADLIEKAIGPRTRAIIPVHLHGHMCNMKQIREIADKYKLRVIEDAAHAIEANRDNIKPGQSSDAVCFSYYATKNITSGEGGAIATNNDGLAEKLRKLRLHGMSKGAAERYSKRYEHWDMEVLGWKCNMNNIQAAMLLNQLKNIELLWKRREDICRKYEEAFKDNSYLDYLRVLPGTKSARHMFTILVSPEKRDKILWELQENGIGVAVNYRAIHLLTFYRENFGYKRGMFPVAEKIGDSTITLPMYPKLSDNEIQYIIETVLKVVKENS